MAPSEEVGALPLPGNQPRQLRALFMQGMEQIAAT